MSRPTPRKSSLSGASPLAPAPEPTEAPPAAESAPKPAKKAPAKKATRAPAGGRPKVSFYADPEDMARARGAYRATSMHEQHRSFSDFLAAAVLAETERLEAKYNGAKPFPSIEAGGIPTGKPMGE